MRKPVFGVSNQVRHKPGCTTTEDDWRIEITDLGSGAKTKGLIREADLRLCFRICKKKRFLMTELICIKQIIACIASVYITNL